MADRPIIFSAPMINSLLAGRKTMTRRLAWRFDREESLVLGMDVIRPTVWQKIRPGDRLWVRETFYCDHCDYPGGSIGEMREMLEYRASHDCRAWEAGCPCRDENGHSSWSPSIHMPRWASRLTLIVETTRIERLQDISEGDLQAEGIAVQSPLGAFAGLWDSLHGWGAWASNPEVVVIGFRPVRANIDRMEAEHA